ncbi:Molybdopterin molybdenumtransferase [Candidatus Magnetomoraceae bacterium gMMP-1]
MLKKRNIYLKMESLEQARKIFFEHFSTYELTEHETIKAVDAVGRILAEPVFAKISSPNYHASAMDGIAVKAENTFGVNETRPKQLIIGKDAFFVNTGHALPEGTNAVIMIENVQQLDDDTLEIESPAFPWQHVRKMGEDIVATEMLFPQNHVVTPYCIGALISGGAFYIAVKKKPKVMIIPTGSELIKWSDVKIENLKSGQVIETNSIILGNLIKSCKGSYVRHGRLVDDLNLISQAVQKATQDDFDMVLIIGGSSAGTEDYSKTVISQLGRVLVHGVTMMPGKPVVLGDVNNKPVVGIPGYQVSAIAAFEQFVKPLICQMIDQPDVQRNTITVEPTRKIASKLGIEEFLRVKLGMVGKKIVASPLPRGAGSITTITEADGIIRIPNDIEGLKINEQVQAELLRPLSAIKNTIVVVGSHDNCLDILADQIRKFHGDLTLSSSHVGSMGGIMAIKRGACHIAGSHLLDINDGSYNISYIKKYLQDKKIRLVNLVIREQGLIISPGNPKNIQGIKDLTKKDITFINRQSGSGTRVLVDYELNKLGINPSNIKGYHTEEFTHMSVAVCVLSGSVDVGPGILAAANALKLDFIPIVTEQYDLIIPEEYFKTKNIQILLKTIQSSEFKERVKALGGYSTEKTGKQCFG